MNPLLLPESGRLGEQESAPPCPTHGGRGVRDTVPTGVQTAHSTRHSARSKEAARKDAPRAPSGPIPRKNGCPRCCLLLGLRPWL